MKIKVPVNYAERRREEYPPIEEQLDALWKGGEAMAEMQQRIAAIKERFPKPAADPAT